MISLERKDDPDVPQGKFYCDRNQIYLKICSGNR